MAQTVQTPNPGSRQVDTAAGSAGRRAVDAKSLNGGGSEGYRARVETRMNRVGHERVSEVTYIQLSKLGAAFAEAGRRHNCAENSQSISAPPGPETEGRKV